MERWQEVEAVLDEVLDSEPSTWPALLDQRCPDAELRRDVESLLRHHSRAKRFLSSPPASTAAMVVDEAQASAPIEGSRVGSYRVVRRIGEGGTSRVYLAARDDGEFTQYVALKVLRPGRDSDVDQGRFRVERQILASLNHPNIARLLDGGVLPDGLPYIVMELVKGLPIDRWCNARALTVRERLKVFLTVCEATRYAHRNLVVHRDLKPSNILVTSDGEVKLLDFGLAKLLQREPRAASTVTSRYWMTPAYAAPEQVRGDVATTLTDVYQLGVVLYELLTGSVPFGNRASSYELAQAILEQEAPPPSMLSRDGRALRGDLDAIVLTALRKEPERRYASVDALRDDVERYLAGLPVLARQGSAMYRMRRYAQRHRFSAAAAAAFVLVLLGYAITLSVHARRVSASLARVEQEKMKAEATSSFLIGLFSPATAGFGPRDTLSARQLIRRGEAELETLRDQPVAQAQMLGVLGSILHSMREYDRAHDLLTRALELRRSQLGETHVDVGEILYRLGRLEFSRGNDRVARDLLTRALGIQRMALPEDHPAVVETTLRLSLLSTSIDTVVASDRRALALARRSREGEHADVAEAMLRLAMSLRNKGAHEESESLMRESLAMRRRVAPADQRNFLRTEVQLAILLRHQGRLAESESLHRAHLAINERQYGPDHPSTAGSLRLLVEVLLESGQVDEAERLARRELGIRERAYGREHPEYAWSEAMLSEVLLGAGRLDEAEVLRRRELALLRARFGERHAETSGSLYGLGLLLLERERYAAADTAFRAAMRLREEQYGAGTSATAAMHVALARLARERRDYPRADSLVRGAIAIYTTEGYLDAQVNMQSAHREALRLYEAWGKLDLAARHRALLVHP